MSEQSKVNGSGAMGVDPSSSDNSTGQQQQGGGGGGACSAEIELDNEINAMKDRYERIMERCDRFVEDCDRAYDKLIEGIKETDRLIDDMTHRIVALQLKYVDLFVKSAMMPDPELVKILHEREEAMNRIGQDIEDKTTDDNNNNMVNFNHP